MIEPYTSGMSSTQPTVFVSSTIYDFRDLRSAIKYLLEELGYRVLLSEYNDFAKPLDQNSYDACISALQQAQYFILIIGGRTGGWYNATERVSITQHEYRTAYEQVRAGRMKLLTFVRSEIWTVREDREALRQLLRREFRAQRELTDDDIAAITSHESTLVNDASAVFSFVREVSRVDEMKTAVAGAGEFPVGNWVHQFTNFRDVVDVLRTEFRMSQRLSRIVIEEGLKRELLGTLQQMTWKMKDGIIYDATWFGSVPRAKLGEDFDSVTRLEGRHVTWLVMYAIMYRSSGSNITLQFVDQALLSGEFLTFDKETDRFSTSGMHEALQLLRENVTRLRTLIDSTSKEAAELAARYKDESRTQRATSIPSRELVGVFAVLDCQQNVINLARAIYAHLVGLTPAVTHPLLNSTSPLATIAADLKRENTTLEDVARWVQESAMAEVATNCTDAT